MQNARQTEERSRNSDTFRNARSTCQNDWRDFKQVRIEAVKGLQHLGSDKVALSELSANPEGVGRAELNKHLIQLLYFDIFCS